MSQAEGFGLSNVTEVRQVRDLSDLMEHLTLAGAFQIFFQLNGTIEVIFDGAFTAAGNDDNILDARRHCFFDGVLNERFVDQRQHLFRGCFCGWKESCPKAGRGNDRFSDSQT
jgi:hypothetical protein